MSHILIIEQNVVIGSEFSKRLCDLGFDSFDHVLTGKDAVVIAKMRPPDLVLIGDSPESGDVLGAARQICETYDTPVLIVAASQAKRP
jgi:DNA-binding response OmpR family regulator|tara:strand:- start:194 stop:457 length:264 start_codon:yes stop_codon:yes gene_type:complete